MASWAYDDQPWQDLEFSQFGLKATLRVKTRKALYYKAGGQRMAGQVFRPLLPLRGLAKKPLAQVADFLSLAG